MAFNYNSLNANSTGSSGDRSPLPTGKYISNPKKKDAAEVQGSSLTILKLIPPKVDKNGDNRYGFLVGSDDVDGTAFLNVTLADYWLTPEACSLAFGKRPKDAAETLWIDPVIAGDLNAEAIEACKNRITEDAVNRVAAANTPEEAQADAVEKAIHNTLLQIQINVGTIFRLQDWAGITRDPQGDLGALEQTVFEGAVKASSLPNGAPEVSVYSLPKGKAVQHSSATEFKTGEPAQ